MNYEECPHYYELIRVLERRTSFEEVEFVSLGLLNAYKINIDTNQ